MKISIPQDSTAGGSVPHGGVCRRGGGGSDAGQTSGERGTWDEKWLGTMTVGNWLIIQT